MTAHALPDPADLGWALGRAVQRYQDLAARKLGALPSGIRGFRVLSTVAAGSGCSQLEIATHLGIDRTQMTYLVDDLATAGLLERQPHPTDRRARTLVLTATGEELLGHLERAMAEVEGYLMAELSAGERDTLRALLLRVSVAAAAEPAPNGDALGPCAAIEQLLG
ncbi:MarR family winged helix-turn-helix transcriptional regulator [Leucobacter sp. M11]|uniref:MarR family winged helix-turn-helix transcriptional regulator n=1 Tax=Leucobacter sp. M11 TaxID=2993565 RepID=UPI002D801347|nr:MarR family transcriptional regulator [Leucobacter sp. M11]MEB4613544.1 MarR family transcriptional regulator [Leucobacter sp. M11]